MDEPNYVVIRPHPDLPTGFLPREMEGRWFDGSQLPICVAPPAGSTFPFFDAVAVPSGQFEFREDGACAEVFEVRP